MRRARTNAAADSVNAIATVRIELCHSDPLIWRQVEVPTSVTLKVLHDIIQAAMGWFDCHLWEFTVGQRKVGVPMAGDWEPRLDAGKIRLRDVLTSPTTVIDYTYDFGDGWEHRLTLTDIRAGEPGASYPRYVGGERNGPLEDCGGIPGFYAMLEALADPAHQDHADAKEWADDYDPNSLDDVPIRYALSRIANRRNAAKSRLAKKRQAGPGS
jgi:hypothetical protein